MLGKRIRIAREAKRLTLRAVGDAVGVTPQAVAQWEKGNPRLDEWKEGKLCDVLGVSVKWLNGSIGEDDKPISSDFISHFGNKIPIIPMNHVILLAPFSQAKSIDIPHDRLVEPMNSPIGRGFAIIAHRENNLLGIKIGDLLIFDTGINPEINDKIIGVRIKDEYIISVLGIYANSSAEGPKKIEGPYFLEEGHNEHDGKADEADENATPIAVLVEHRRLRNAVGIERF